MAVILGKCQDCGRYVYAYNGQTFRVRWLPRDAFPGDTAQRAVYIHDCKERA